MHEGRIVAGRYRIERPLAVGSMGEVYQAMHVGLGKLVAIKLIAPAHASSPETAVRFRREARMAGALESDYIVQVFDAGRDDELGLYLVTELLVGEDLETRIARDEVLDPPIVAAIGYQVARGLAKAHVAGVIHRDLKPGNIFIAQRDDGARVAKILDFGISKRMPDALWDDEEDSYVTAVGITLGTPDYMSPEQARGQPDLDGRSDVWSLGATLYEALCGHPPHVGGSSATERMQRNAYDDAPPLSSIAPWVPRDLSAVVHAALERDRDRRTPDAATFARAIERAVPQARWALSGLQRSSPPSAPVSSGPPTVPAPPPDDCDEPPEPPSSANPVQFFRRDGFGFAG